MSSRVPFVASLTLLLLLPAVVSCGGGGDAEPSEATADVEGGADTSDPCTLLRPELITRTFRVDEGVLTVEGGRGATHALCTASWPRPDAEEIEARMQELLAEHVERRRQAQAEGRDLDEPLPDLRSHNSVYLTIGETFDEPAEAVARLEAVVRQMEEGIATGEHGDEQSAQMVFEDFRTDVGDEAAWNPGMSQLSVAAHGVLFHVRVEVSDEPSENREWALELARAIVDRLG